MNKENQELEYVYNEVLAIMERFLKEGHSPLAVAAVFATQAMGLYKTMLSDEEYHSMIDSIVDKKNHIQTYSARSLH